MARGEPGSILHGCGQTDSEGTVPSMSQDFPMTVFYLAMGTYPGSCFSLPPGPLHTQYGDAALCFKEHQTAGKGDACFSQKDGSDWSAELQERAVSYKQSQTLKFWHKLKGPLTVTVLVDMNTVSLFLKPVLDHERISYHVPILPLVL